MPVAGRDAGDCFPREQAADEARVLLRDRVAVTQLPVVACRSPGQGQAVVMKSRQPDTIYTERSGRELEARQLLD